MCRYRICWIIEGGSTIDEFFEDFPSVTREQVVEFLELAKDQRARAMVGRRVSIGLV